MIRAAVVIVWIGCSHTTPVSPRVSTFPCMFNDEPIYANHPVEGTITWICTYGYAGYPDTCSTAITDVRASCAGVPCRIEAMESPERPSPQRGSRAIRITPTAPGPLRLAYTLTHANGTQTIMPDACDVERAPEVRTSCAIRDSATGAYTPCPTTIAPGIDVHAAVEVRFDEQSTTAHPDIRLYRVDGESPRETDMTCTLTRKETVARRCTWSSAPGRYEVRVKMGNYREQLPLDVQGGPGTTR